MTRPLVITRWGPFCLGTLLLTLATLGAVGASPKQVLLLHSFGKEFAPFSTFSGAFRTELGEQLGDPVEFHDVAVESARFEGGAAEVPLVDYLTALFGPRRLDLVVTVGGPAARFAQKYRQQLFSLTPMLIAAVDERLLETIALTTNDVVVAVRNDPVRMMDSILQVLPETTNVVVVIGNSPLEKFWLGETRRQFQQFTNQMSFVWFNELSFAEMRKRAAALPPRSVIYYPLMYVDAEGVPYGDEQALRGLHAVANAPIFGLHDSQMGRGIVGGPLMAFDEMSQNAAQVAARILRGEPAGSIQTPTQVPGRPIYDWRELKRWGISETRLPPGSVIRFRQPPFWKLYAWPIAGVVLFCLLQAALIIGLLVNRAKRRQGEAEATLIADISSKFVNLPAGEVDREILDAQRRICEYLGLDLSALWQWSDEASNSLMLTHLYRTQEGPSAPERMTASEYFPWCQQQVLAGRIIAVASLEELPAEAARDRETWRHFGIKTTLTIPLSVGGGPPFGTVSFNTTRAERDWPDALVKRLELVAQIFANALARKRADQALRESEERMTLAAEAADFGIWVWNIARNEVWGSERWLRLFGFRSGDDVSFEKVIQRIHPDDREKVERELRRAVADGHDYAGEFRAVLPDGTQRWLASRGRGYPDANGKPARMLGTAIDITHRKRTEEAFRTSEARLAAGADLAGLGYYEVDFGERACFIDDRFSEICGIPSGQQPGLKPVELWMEHLHPDDRQHVLDERQKLHDGRIEVLSIEYRYLHPVHGQKWIHHLGRVATRNATGSVVRAFGVVRDIGYRKQAEEVLQETKTTLSAIIESTDDLIWSVDPHSFGLMTFNRGLRDYFFQGRGIRIEPGMRPEDLFPAGEYVQRWRGFYQRALQEGPFTTEYLVYIQNRILQLSFNVLRRDGKAFGVSAFGKDITKQRKAQREAHELRTSLAHSGRVTLLGQLASALAHELNQPLGAILRNAEAAELMLQMSSPDLQELRAIVTDIRKDDQRAGQVIERLRSLLKRRGLDLQPVELNGVIAEVLSLVQTDAAGRRVKLVYSAVPELPSVRGDRIHLQQVLLNLLVNALDALAGAAPSAPSIQVTAHRTEAGMVEVRVCDNGPGIPAVSPERLFEAFFTTKANGMGLGLAVSKTIIEAHQGRIWAETRPEGGACFCFTVPVADGVKELVIGSQ